VHSGRHRHPLLHLADPKHTHTSTDAAIIITIIVIIDTDGPMAKDLRAALERTFTSDSRTVPWPPEQQGFAPILTTSSKKRRIHARHRGPLGALPPCRGPQHHGRPHPILSNNHAAAAHARIHQHRAHHHLIRWANKQSAPRLVYCPDDDTATVAPTLPLP
jgi:hypothetical protein